MFASCCCISFPKGGFQFWSITLLIFMPYSGYLFCWIRWIKFICKSNILHIVLFIDFYILPGETSAFTQGQKHSIHTRTNNWSSTVWLETFGLFRENNVWSCFSVSCSTCTDIWRSVVQIGKGYLFGSRGNLFPWKACS